MNRYFGIVLVVIVLLACRNSHTAGTIDNAPDDNTELPESFLLFYQLFHQDSAFQMSRIAFPIMGLPAHLDSLRPQDFRWRREDWVLHRHIDPENEMYSQDFYALGNTVIEKISIRNSPFSMERRFAEMADGWHLIYYAEMRPTQSQ